MGAESGDFALLYADDALLVLDKPAGLLSVPGRGAEKQDCLSARVQRHYPQAQVVHRLDMATSGLMLMARATAVQRQLSKAFAERRIHKQYQAIVHGVIAPPLANAPDPWQMIDLPMRLDWPNRPKSIIDVLGGKPSQTRWRWLAAGTIGETTRLLLEPLTGRSHQLRVHLQALGHPILGDTLYASADVQALASRLLLHATRLCFVHPVSGESLQFDSVVPF